jgi:serine/threonine-protein kinase
VQPGTLIDGRYRVARALGRGAMGSVLLAEDEGLERKVAIKIIGDIDDTIPDAALRFRKEAAALAKIRHGNVVQVYAAGSHEGKLFFAMEYVEGDDVERIVDRHRENGEHVPVLRALTILEEVAAALNAIHLAGHVHRDVKPANVVIEEATGRPVVVDLGLAVSIDNQGALPSLSMGTPAYAAPEQVQSSGVSPRTDIYALACTAFELFTGAPPFVHDDPDVVLVQQLSKQPPSISTRRPELSALDAPLSVALSKDPERRQSSAPELVRALREAIGVHAEVARETPAHLEDALRVLVVDDDPDFCRLIAACANIAFREAKVHVEAVHSGREAIDHVHALAPHLIFLDYAMPGLDGIETLSRIRALPIGNQIRVVVVSAHDQRWRFSVLGVNDFVGKGSSPAELTNSLRAVREKYGFAPRRPEG